MLCCLVVAAVTNLLFLHSLTISQPVLQSLTPFPISSHLPASGKRREEIFCAPLHLPSLTHAAPVAHPMHLPWLHCVPSQSMLFPKCLPSLCSNFYISLHTFPNPLPLLHLPWPMKQLLGTSMTLPDPHYPPHAFLHPIALHVPTPTHSWPMWHLLGICMFFTTCSVPMHCLWVAQNLLLTPKHASQALLPQAIPNWHSISLTLTFMLPPWHIFPPCGWHDPEDLSHLPQHPSWPVLLTYLLSPTCMTSLANTHTSFPTHTATPLAYCHIFDLHFCMHSLGSSPTWQQLLNKLVNLRGF